MVKEVNSNLVHKSLTVIGLSIMYFDPPILESHPYFLFHSLMFSI